MFMIMAGTTGAGAVALDGVGMTHGYGMAVLDGDGTILGDLIVGIDLAGAAA
jgi:hypothetical protein